VPLFVALRAFDSLDAYQQFRGSFQPNPQLGQKLPTLLSAAPSSEMWEIPGAGLSGPVARFTVRFTYYPAQGKLAELQQAIQGRVNAVVAAGSRTSLWLLVSGGPNAIASVTGFDRLADIEQVRARNLADPAARAYSQSLNALLAAPVESPDTFEILTQAT
ncbi:MAG: hypothetical protein ACR2PL_12385, partial [Dehalococcoidia bacterium]